MKSPSKTILILAVLLGAAAVSAMKWGAHPGHARKAAPCCLLGTTLDMRRPPARVAETTAAPAAIQSIIVYYFHGTVRCETCQLIEAQSKSVIEHEFSAEIASNRLAFVTVDYDQPENAHYLTDYRLPCPSLVLVRHYADGQIEWKLLGNTWEFVEDPRMLGRYVETEVWDFLSGQDRQAGTNQIGPSAAPDHP